VSTTIFEGFSVSHAAILDGIAPAEDVAAEMADIYGIREGGLAVDEGNYDNTGDDAVLSSWLWFNHVNVTVKSGYIPFSVISLLTGSTITSSGAGAGATYSLPLWEVESSNQAQRPVLLRVPSKDSVGNVRNLDFVLYKVQFGSLKFDGPNYKAGLVVDYSGRALVSTEDEMGNPLAKRGIGRLISSPAT
jgi:hypothetical protein